MLETLCWDLSGEENGPCSASRMVKCSQEKEEQWEVVRGEDGDEAARSASSVPQPLLVLPGLQ